jgi:hypothetical protein
MSMDRVTIGLTPVNKAFMELLMEKGWFNDKMDAAKFAMAIVIKKGLEPSIVEGTETVWNIGSFDTTSEIRSLILALFPATEVPYRVVEYYINAGLEEIQLLLDNEQLDITELLRQIQ